MKRTVDRMLWTATGIVLGAGLALLAINLIGDLYL